MSAKKTRRKPSEKPQKKPGLVSVVVPMHNEEGIVEELHRRVSAVMTEVGLDWEIVLVDDGSTDGTLAALVRLSNADEHVCVVELRRNFGQTPALAAGFDHAQGEVIVAMDGDLENLPEDIPKLLDRLEEGYDIVSGWRRDRTDGLFLRRLPSRAANRLMRKISGVEIHDFGCTLKAYRRDVLEHVQMFDEMHRFIPALAAIAGARVTEIPVGHELRRHGKSHYGVRRLLRVLMDLLTIKFLLSYRTRPLHLFGRAGVALFGIAVLTVVYVLVQRPLARLLWHLHIDLFRMDWQLAVVLVVLFVLSGLLCFMMGLLGEVLARSWHDGSGRRIYAVRKVHRRGGADR